MNNLGIDRTMRASCVAVTLTAASIFTAGNAGAQEWLKDRSYQEGAGVRAGDLEIHPGIGGEFGYDSNYLERSPKNDPTIANAAPQAPVEPAGVLRLTPSLSISTLGQQRREGDELRLTPPVVAFRAGLAGTYRELFGAEIIRKQRNFAADANARVEILPERPLGFGVLGTYERTIRPSATGTPDRSFNRDDLSAAAEVIVKPGGGTLDWRVGYRFYATLFEDSIALPYTNLTHELYTRGRWRFRPRTALLYDASFRWLDYTEANRATTLLTDGNPTRARIGLTGLVTPRVGFSGLVGYGATFFQNANAVYVRQYDSVIGQAELRYFLATTPTQDPDQTASLSVSSVAVGYNRDFQTSYLGNYYGLDRGYLKFVYMFAGRLLLSIEGGAGALSYPDFFLAGPGGVPAMVSSSFTDIRLDGTLFTEYRFTSAFGVNATVRYNEEISDKLLPLGSTVGGGPGTYDLSYRRIEAFAGVRLFL